MNKTININLGGIFFHIDENAFEKLNRYLDAVRRSLANDTGEDEIIKDIEIRISEIFSETRKTDNHVITVVDVEKMIAIMGQPEDYRIEENDINEPRKHKKSQYRKLYRDIDHNVLGGVCAGIGHYFGIDSLWVRLIFVAILLLGWGSPIFIYILLWVLIPKALTTSEKLAMTGEPVNLSNIEKKVREELGNVSDRISSIDYDKFGNEVQKGGEKIGTAIGAIFTTIFTVFGKGLGILITILSLIFIGSLIVGLLSAGTTSLIDMPWQQYVDSVLVSGFPIWVLSLLMFLFLGIPAFFLMILGLKLIIPNMKSIGNVAKYTLLGLWFLTIIIASVFGAKQGSEFFYESKEVKKENVFVTVSDTLMIKMKSNPNYENDLDHNSSDYKIIKDENNRDIMYLKDIAVRFKYTEDKNVSIHIEKKAKGNSLDNAKERARAINYNYMIDQNTIYLNDYMTTDLKNKFRGQEIEIIIYLPEGTVLKTDNRFDNFFENHYYDLEYFENIDGAIHKVENQKLKCLNCKNLVGYENHENIEKDSIGYGYEIKVVEDTIINKNGTKVVINKDGITVEKDNKAPENKEFKGLKIDKDGIIIKTE
jgi:phage shock protein PspC (stress-responsive transcriptional regulator)